MQEIVPHTGPKIGVEKEYTIIFHDFFDTKIRHTFKAKSGQK